MSTEAVGATLGVLRLSMAVAGVATLLLAGGVVLVAVRQGLAPLRSMAHDIEAIGHDDLGRRIPEANAPDELRPVAARTNAMLDRIQVMVERERRFTSDVAHELRTPLAELRTLAEVSARRDGMPAADRQSFLDAKEIAIRLDRLTGTLLDLSRCSSGQIAKHVQPADLGRLIESTWKPFASAAATKELDVNISTEGSAEIETDPLILETILSNLFSNAVEYTPAGGEIRLRCQPSPGGIAVTLSNSTRELTREDLPRLAEKFWRKHGPDSRTHGHLGLGLSLVDALSNVLDARFECELPEPGEFRARLVHPN